jgi:hypothetical protein
LIRIGFYGKETIYRVFASFTGLGFIILAIIAGWHVGYQHLRKVCGPESGINFAFTQEFLYVSCGIFHHKYWTIGYLISMQWGTAERLNYLSLNMTYPATTDRIQNPIHKGDCCGDVRIGTGIMVKTIVVGAGLAVLINAGAGVVGKNVGISGAEVVGTLTGSPRSIRIVSFAADWRFSTLMENVLVAVPDEVWKATTARPSASVVTRA